MAAIASPWAKPGAWALDSEENEAELLQQQQQQQQQSNPRADASAVEFPSLSAAAATKTSKKKNKGQTMSLAELASYSSTPSYKPPSQPAARGLTHEDLLALPTGPRERTAEELDRSRLGGGFRSYAGRYGDESGNNRRGGFDESRVREPLPPSRADEIDDWGAAKKQLGAAGNGFDRRERGSSGFFNSNSKADESDNWASNKSMETGRFSNESSEFGRERRGFRGGFEGMSNGGGADSDRWGRKPQDEVVADSDRWSRRTQGEGGADTDRWSRKPQDEGTLLNPSRPKLLLQPRTVPVGEGSGGSPTLKPKGSSPFGNARPREEVLKEKGQDWKEIDEKLENVKIKEEKTEAFGKRGFGSGNGRVSPQEQDGKTEGSWRKADADSAEAAIPSGENVEAAAEVESDDNPKAEA